MYLACICCFHKDVCVASSKYTCIWLAFACICCFPYEVNTALSEYRYTCIWLAFIVFIRILCSFIRVHVYLASICCFHKDVCVASSEYTSIWPAFAVFIRMFV